MTDCVHLDIETYSECDLKRSGLYRYAEHPSTEILVVCYAFGDGPVNVWVPRNGPLPEEVSTGIIALLDEGANLYCMLQTPKDLDRHISHGGEIRAHNAQFERVVLNGVAGQKLDFPKLQIGQMVCTAAKAAAASLPRDLGGAAEALGTFPKKAVGKNDMLACAKPRNKESEPRWTPENDPRRFIRLYDYCIDDVKAERDVDKHTPDLTPSEQGYWEMDQRLNDRGVAVDLKAIDDILFLVNERKKELAARCVEITGVKPSQTAQVAEWVRKNGYPRLLNLQADTVNKAQRDDKCPPLIKELLMIYSAHAMKAVSKYDAILRAVCADGRLHGMFMFYGANTGRWSSMIVQLQNLFRPIIKNCDVAVEAAALRDLEWLKFLYPGLEPMKILASCIRSVFVAGEGKKLISIDYSGIESRYTAWMFNEVWKIAAFLAYDKGEGPDTYKQAYARSFQVLITLVTDEQRQIGKVEELAFAFEGGVGACVTAAAAYNIDLNELAEAVWPTIPQDVMDKSIWMYERFGHTVTVSKRVYLALNSLKEMWRIAHPAHVQGWRDMKDAAILAVQNPGVPYQIPTKRIMFKMQGDWLLMRLASGRMVRYYKPVIEYDFIECPDCEWAKCPNANCVNEFVCDLCTPYGGRGVPSDPACGSCGGSRKIRNDRSARLTYLGVDTDTRQWTRTGTYGGKLTENGAQAGSSCLLRAGLAGLEEAEYWPVMTIHDQAVCEVDVGFGSLEEAKAIYIDKPSWAAGLPVAAEGWEGKRFRK